MTIKFDIKARQQICNIPLPHYRGAAKDLYIKRVPIKEARGWIAEYHYSHIMPDSSKEVFAGYYPGDILAGFIVFGMGTGVKQFTRILPMLQNGEYRELTRLWSPDDMPHNTESRLIALAMKQLKHIRLFLSYADRSQGHVGTIYQATNWLYTGKTNKGKRLVNQDGQEQHSRLVSMYRKRHPELYGKMTISEIIKKIGWTEIENPPKYRYVKVTNKRDYKLIQKTIPILPYPKINQ